MVVGTVIAGGALLALSVQGTLAVVLVVRLRGDLAALAELARQAAGLALVAVLVVAGAGLVAFFGAYALAALVALAGTGALVAPTRRRRPAVPRTPRPRR